MPRDCQSNGVTRSSVITSLGYPCVARNAWRRSRNGRASVVQLMEPLRLGTGSKTYKVEQASGAVVESSSEGMVTSRDGSGISRPRWSASKDELHSSPKWML